MGRTGLVKVMERTDKDPQQPGHVHRSVHPGRTRAGITPPITPCDRCDGLRAEPEKCPILVLKTHRRRYIDVYLKSGPPQSFSGAYLREQSGEAPANLTHICTRGAHVHIS